MIGHVFGKKNIVQMEMGYPKTEDVRIVGSKVRGSKLLKVKRKPRTPKGKKNQTEDGHRGRLKHSITLKSRTNYRCVNQFKLKESEISLNVPRFRRHNLTAVFPRILGLKDLSLYKVSF